MAPAKLQQLAQSRRGIIGLVIVLGALGFLFMWQRSPSAWELYQKEFVAGGEHLDWEHFIPPAVKEEENFFAAPQMRQMFQKPHQSRASSRAYSVWELPPERAQWKLLKGHEAMIEGFNGTTYPASVILQWEAEHREDLESFFEAGRRPRSRLLTDFTKPLSSDVPNFVAIRTAVQTMGTLAKAHLQAGEPEKAMNYVNGIHRLMETLSRGQTIVEAMIHVAIAGLYVDVVQFGFEKGAWTDGQLRALQGQLAGTKLLPGLAFAFRAQIGFVLRAVETSSITELNGPGSGFRLSTDWTIWRENIDQVRMRVAFSSAREKNLLNFTRMAKANLAVIDPVAERVFPKEVAARSAAMTKALASQSLDTVLASVTIPNFARATETAAKNQTLVNQAAVVCALELYRRSEGHYPGKLDELMGRFLSQVPRDVITGQTLPYRRTAADAFKLYSVGWDESDDGGTVADWVWPGPPLNKPKPRR